MKRLLSIVVALVTSCGGDTVRAERAVAPPPVIAAPMQRALTSGERAMLEPIFRDGVDYDQVRVVHGATLFQPANVYVTIGTNVYAPGALFLPDFSSPTLRADERSVLVHEIVHVWQHTNGMSLLGESLRELVKHRGRYDAAYPYLLEAGRDLVELGMEQQASLVEDFYLITVERRRPMSLLNRGMPRARRDALYASVLRQFLANARYAQPAP